MKIKLFNVLLLTALLTTSCITVKGKIAVQGNEPHAYLVIVTEDTTAYKITGKLHDEIWNNYQGQTLKVKGRVVKEAQGSLLPAELDVIEILEVIQE